MFIVHCFMITINICILYIQYIYTYTYSCIQNIRYIRYKCIRHNTICNHILRGYRDTLKIIWGLKSTVHTDTHGTSQFPRSAEPWPAPDHTAPWPWPELCRATPPRAACSVAAWSHVFDIDPNHLADSHLKLYAARCWLLAEVFPISFWPLLLQ